MHGSSKPEGDRLDSDRYAYPRSYDIEEVRQKLEKKIMVLREEWFAEVAAKGWSHDAEHDCMVPPGWVRA